MLKHHHNPFSLSPYPSYYLIIVVHDAPLTLLIPHYLYFIPSCWVYALLITTIPFVHSTSLLFTFTFFHLIYSFAIPINSQSYTTYTLIIFSSLPRHQAYTSYTLSLHHTTLPQVVIQTPPMLLVLEQVTTSWKFLPRIY